MDGSRLSYLYPANAYPLYLLAEKLHRRYCTFGSYRYVIYQKQFKTALGLSEGGFCICTKIEAVKLVFLWKVCYNLIKITPSCSGHIGGYYEALFGIIMV